MRVAEGAVQEQLSVTRDDHFGAVVKLARDIGADRVRQALHEPLLSCRARVRCYTKKR
ncbi:MAG: hypothetical protein QGI52_06350 [Alphaproteobacteria bacterium]|nr:hypothetical protein [Alphaproteobacteria bacterium]